MSVSNTRGEKVILERVGPGELWDELRHKYAGDNPRKLKALGVLALRENAGWTMEQIGQVFGHQRGHITRILTNIKQELRATIRLPADFFSDPECSDLDDSSPDSRGTMAGQTPLPWNERCNPQ